MVTHHYLIILKMDPPAGGIIGGIIIYINNHVMYMSISMHMLISSKRSVAGFIILLLSDVGWGLYCNGRLEYKGVKNERY